MKKKTFLTVCLAAFMATSFSLTACGGNGDNSSGGDTTTVKQGTYRTFTTIMPSNWNELTYQDNNDTQIMNYLSSSFFEYDYKFDEAKGGKYKADGTVNADAIVTGGYTINYSAATKLEDVTGSVDAKWGYTDEQKAKGGYAWRITLRPDLKWDDGTEIHAADFVYSMQEQLNPKFLNYRANTFYDTLRIKNSRAYFNQAYPTVEQGGYKSNAEAIAAGKVLYLDVHSLWGAKGYVDKDGKECPQLLPITDETVYDTADAWSSGKAKDAFSAKALYEENAAYLEVGGGYAKNVRFVAGDDEQLVKPEDVGIYAEGKDTLVVLFDVSYKFLEADESLAWRAGYFMQSLPLVQKTKYEASKVAPAAGSLLWTTRYNSDLASTASWGPYKLTAFQSAKGYTLEKNSNWYGYKLDAYKNQYNVTSIKCECIPEPSTQWTSFFAGNVDSITIDAAHYNDYKDSKYLTYTPSTGTFGMQLYGNKNVLKASGNNNGILAIDEFRQAVSLSINRSDVVEKIWPGSTVPCFGLMNDQYFYDVENGGVYRFTTQAKEGILRAYGFTKGDDGKWSGGEIVGASLDDAYEALTGYNPAKAKELVRVAYEKLTANAADYGYDSTKDIKMYFGCQVINDKQRTRVAYVQSVIDTLCKDTPLEGKIKLELKEDGNAWSDAFRSGQTQIGFGYGFSGNPFNPFSLVGGFVDSEDNLNYHTYWNTKQEMMTLTMPAGDYDGAGETITMSLCNWFYCINGLAEEKGGIGDKKYDWGEGQVPAEARLTVLAALEEKVIQKSYSVMLIGEASGNLDSPKFTQISYDYNTFMAYGGIRYLRVEYTDDEWKQYMTEHNNTLEDEYKKAD